MDKEKGILNVKLSLKALSDESVDKTRVVTVDVN